MTDSTCLVSAQVRAHLREESAQDARRDEVATVDAQIHRRVRRATPEEAATWGGPWLAEIYLLRSWGIVDAYDSEEGAQAGADAACAAEAEHLITMRDLSREEP